MNGGNGDDNGGNGDTPEIGGDDAPGGYHEYAPIGEPAETDINVPMIPEYVPETDAPGTPIPDDNGNDYGGGGDSGSSDGWNITNN